MSEFGDFYPSLVEMKIKDEIFKKLISRSDLRWCSRKIDNNVNITISSLHRFHEPGIYIYSHDMTFSEYTIYIMYDVNKKDIVDFAINQIIKQKNGN